MTTFSDNVSNAKAHHVLLTAIFEENIDERFIKIFGSRLSEKQRKELFKQLLQMKWQGQLSDIEKNCFIALNDIYHYDKDDGIYNEAMQEFLNHSTLEYFEFRNQVFLSSQSGIK
ncbi:hypothetical protein KPA96_13655 [Burkholderia cenocepacia]|uniref:hypothetical protein n=1 Tax=Burkholderia cenocepacia TaxID=95486 RepID=UPI00285D7D28|nr:hypothetical protein [Burkholderia cenocepacia]MDR8076702.1 hypothetical protein [Burkholderia cenocepacia]